MLLACNRANAPRAKQAYAGLTCESDVEEVDAEVARLSEQQLSDPPEGCEPGLEVCPALRMGF